MYTKETVVNTARWIVSMQKIHNAQIGMQCFDAVRTVFGDDLCADVLFAVMSNAYEFNAVQIDCSKLFEGKYIESIKLVRHISGFGLKDAKDTVDASMKKIVYVPLRPEYIDPTDEVLRDRDLIMKSLNATGAVATLVHQDV